MVVDPLQQSPKPSEFIRLATVRQSIPVSDVRNRRVNACLDEHPLGETHASLSVIFIIHRSDSREMRGS